MKSRMGLIAVLIGVTAGPLSGPVRSVAADDAGSPLGVVSDAVSVTVKTEAGGAMTGVVRNTGPRAVRDVRLLIRHSWLWNDERHPGPPAANPGRSSYYVVDGEVPAAGEIRFRYVPSPRLPSRTDGSFVSSAVVVSLTEVEGTE